MRRPLARERQSHRQACGRPSFPVRCSEGVFVTQSVSALSVDTDLTLLPYITLPYLVSCSCSLHESGRERRLVQRRYFPAEGRQTMRLTGVPGERRGPGARREIQEVSRVSCGHLLLQDPRHAAHVRAP